MQIEKDSIITFVENVAPKRAEFNGKERVFSMLYSKIIEAARFCELEGVDVVYLGFRNQVWQIEFETTELEYFVAVTASGLDHESQAGSLYAIQTVTIV